METNNSHHRRISSIRGIPFIVLAVLFVAGGIIFFSKWRFAQPGSQPHLNIPANSNNAMFGFDLQRTRFNQSERILNITNVSHLVPYWSASTAAYINSSPAVANGIVYIGSEDRNVYAFNATTGTLLWKTPTGDLIHSSPAVANGIVYIGSTDNKLYAFDAMTGKPRWTLTTGDRIYSSPTVANGIVYVSSQDHKLYALDAITGAILWTYTTGDAIDSSPAVANGMVYVGSFDGKVYAFHL